LKRLFVTGTDTGVGKTVVASALVAAFSSRKQRVGVMKPCETGGGDDAERLVAATGRTLDLSLVRPYAFAMPASPEAAAQAAGARVALGRIRRTFDALASSADVMVVEGAGGLLVPLGQGVLTADLVQLLGLPLLIVARPSLLTVEAARRRGIEVVGVVFSRSSDREGPDEATNPAAIESHGQITVLGTLPRLPPEAFADRVALAASAERYLQVDRILSLLS
jgi:dethiobiotin synthetase